VALLDQPEQEAEAGELTVGDETMVTLAPRAERSKCIAFALREAARADE
jgi:hypothetical protein